MKSLRRCRHHVCSAILVLLCAAEAAPSAQEIAALCEITLATALPCTDCSVGCGVVCGGTKTISFCDANQTAITDIWLNNTQLSTLPESISSLQQLTVLYLHNNQLTELPASIGSLPQLTWLRLDYNLLNELPESIGSLHQLLGLRLHNNKLSSLPGSIFNLTALSFVSLYGNCLNCSDLEYAPTAIKSTCTQSEQTGDCTEPETFSSSSSSRQQGVTVVVIIKFLEDVVVTDPTELEEEIASVLGIDAGLVSVVVISPTEVEVTIIGSEETAQHLIEIINNGGAGSGSGSGLGLLRKAIEAHIRKDTDGSSDDDGVDAAPRVALFHALFVGTAALLCASTLL